MAIAWILIDCDEFILITHWNDSYEIWETTTTR